MLNSYCVTRFEDQVADAIQQTVSKFGGLDILINNASAISTTDTQSTSMKTFDLMQTINTRGTFLVTKLAVEHLRKSNNPHVLTLSPPLIMHDKWFSRNTAYTIAKYGMSMCALGMAAEFAEDGIAFNCLWPRTVIWTAAVNMLLGSDGMTTSRKPDIMADAAYAIITKNSRKYTGNFLIDEVVLRGEGVEDFDAYAMSPGSPLMSDGFIPDNLAQGLIGFSAIAGPSLEPKSKL